jgi:hypothetical protein
MDTEKNSALFLSLVMTFHAAAMQQMGKVKHPLSEKIERDLDQAQMSIDILDMLKDKTKGNLSDDETKLISNVLQELKLNYVDEASKKQPEDEKKDGSA